MKTGGATPLNTAGKSFTLVEMLVVISIIAILAALLLPEIGMVKDRAKAVTCAHNEKRMGEAFTGYLNDNQGFYPYVLPSCVNDTNNHTIGGCALGNVGGNGIIGGAYCTASPSWNVSLAPYYGYSSCAFIQNIGDNFCNNGAYGSSLCPAPYSGWCSGPTYDAIAGYAPFMQCPSNPWQIPTLGMGLATVNSWPQCGDSSWRIFATTYAMNGDGFPVDWNAGGGNCANPAGFNKCMNMADINHPSSLALIGEMPWDVWAAGSPANNFGLAYLPGGNDAPWMTADRVSTNTGPQNKAHTWTNVTRFACCNGYMAAWHHNNMNTLFPDGHVEQISQSTLTNYSVQYQTPGTAMNSPGWLFFNDGKAQSWYAGQFPGYNFPQRKD